MAERAVSLSLVLAGALWAVSALLALSGVVVVFVAHGHKAMGAAMALMLFALMFAAMATTASVRMLLLRQGEVLREIFRIANDTSEIRKLRR